MRPFPHRVDREVHVAHLAIGVWMTDQAPEGVDSMTADEIAPLYGELASERATHELVIKN